MPVHTQLPPSLLPERPMRTSTDFSSEPPQLVFRVYRGPVTLGATINLFRRELHWSPFGERESHGNQELSRAKKVALRVKELVAQVALPVLAGARPEAFGWFAVMALRATIH